MAVIVDATLKSGSIAESCRGAHVSGGLSHRRPKIIVHRADLAGVKSFKQRRGNAFGFSGE
ncbi:hypothetical protein Pth03_66640 [Planotetraspora thailandica]|uniref:Uncharacterized protein n=1 Tax=Planotetraspora thailandica TaxID=487172 RepID=A0A8J4DDM6_9ACTN|nr:hypothetical protein Pth03_66640 [Planotetraspora thailandica]